MLNLELLRRLSGRTQIRLALDAGVSQATISAAERGEGVLKPVDADRISRVLGAPADFLMRTAHVTVPRARAQQAAGEMKGTR